LILEFFSIMLIRTDSKVRNHNLKISQKNMRSTNIMVAQN
jgi:hypothetical protein